MKHFEKILDHKTGQQVAHVMEIICYVAGGLFVAMLALACMGRAEYDLRTVEGHYPRAIYAEESHEFDTRVFTISNTNDQIYVHASKDEDKIQLATQGVIVTLFAMNLVPVIVVAFLLGRLFGNIARGDIFSLENVHCLATASGIKAMVALVIPFLKLGLVGVADNFLEDNISLGTGSNLLEDLAMAGIFFVAAYVIYAGTESERVKTRD